MRNCLRCAGWTAGLALLLSALAVSAEKPAEVKETIRLQGAQKELLSLEPILVTARLESASIAGLPPGPGKGPLGSLQFEVKPAVKPRNGAKPLPLEAQATGGVKVRTYDLLEWYQFPAEGGPYTVRLLFEQDGRSLASDPIQFHIRRPAKDDAEHGPVDRIHHIPWTNYGTDAFCGDTFDVVKRWPSSKLSRYCHYWNGRYSQHKKEYDKAIASYRVVIEQYPDLPLADHAAFGIAECLLAQNKKDEARKQLLTWQGNSNRNGQTVIHHLVAEALRGDAGARR
jgi:hypothetical protein